LAWPAVAGTEKDIEEVWPVSNIETATLKMLGSLLLIVGIILCMFYLIKRSRFSPLSINRQSKMRVIGTLSLAPKRSIALVEVYNQWLILGVGTENVTLLSKVDRPHGEGVTKTISPVKPKSFRSYLQDKAFRNNKDTSDACE
jgi:flagellar protein FliO/FliZ